MRECRSEQRRVVSFSKFGEVQCHRVHELLVRHLEALYSLALKKGRVSEDGNIGAHESIQNKLVGPYLSAVGVVCAGGEET